MALLFTSEETLGKYAASLSLFPVCKMKNIIVPNVLVWAAYYPFLN